MNSISLIFDILGAPRGCVLPLAYALDEIAERMFRQHIAMEDIKMCEVCRSVSERLYYNIKPSSVDSEVRRWAKRCSNRIMLEGWTEKYFGKQVSNPGDPRDIIIFLATYAYFDKPYYQMIREHKEYFTGQLSAAPSLP